MPKKGYLTPKTYFPKKGDILEEAGAAGERGISWLCVRVSTYRDELTGKTLKDALLIGRHESLGDEPIPMTFHNSDDMVEKLKDFTAIRRKDRNGDLQPYYRTEKGTFAEP